QTQQCANHAGGSSATIGVQASGTGPSVQFECNTAGSVSAGLAFHVAAQGCQQPRTGGDMNCDTLKDGADISAWVLAAINPTGYQSAFPNCNILNGDFNTDQVV